MIAPDGKDMRGVWICRLDDGTYLVEEYRVPRLCPSGRTVVGAVSISSYQGVGHYLGRMAAEWEEEVTAEVNAEHREEEGLPCHD